MLHHLRVRNLGVLEDAEISPGPGFTVITGETGAGKTLLLGALRLLTGGKPQSGAVGPFGSELHADGLFELDEEELGASRIVPADGRSRAYLEGSMVSAQALADRMGPLVDIVGQHDQVRLKRPGVVLELVDSVLDDEGQAARAGYARAWETYRDALAARESLGGDRPALERELDLVGHQAREIEAAGLSPGDDEALETLASRLRNAEAIRDLLSAAVAEVENMSERSGEVVASMRRISELDPGSEQARLASEELAEQVNGLSRALREIEDASRDDPAAAAEAEERLNAIGDLKRKYGRTVDEVITFGFEARERAEELQTLLDRAETIDAEVTKATVELTDASRALTAARARAVDVIGSSAAAHLADLALPRASLRLRMEQVEPGPRGADRISVLFASDERLDEGEIGEVASGGELSRLVLALRLATSGQDGATLVFDEVDAGVGGATALALGRKLADLARSTQVLCVTHLPQVAAHADTHYVVMREGPSATVAPVDGEARLEELSRMLAGLPESAPGREAAAELLAAAGH